MKYVFAGSDTTAAAVLKWLCEHHPPVLVITREDAAFGRKKELRETKVAAIGSENGIEVIKTNDPSGALEKIEQSGATRGIVVSYGAILKDQVLASLDWYNLHFSLLPQLRGAAPVQRAILDNETPTGVSVFQIDKGMDTGPIYDQQVVDIDSLNTEQALEKMTAKSLPILKALLEDEHPSLTQQQPGGSLAPKLSRDECRLDFNRNAQSLHRVVLAAYPEPVAWTEHKGQPFRIISANTNGLKVPEDDKLPGSVEKVGGKVYVVCGDSTRLELIQVQPFSKKPMAATDWFNGVGETILGN